MTVASGIGGPVSIALEADLRSWVRRSGIVVWLDLDDHYSSFVDRLAELRRAGDLPYEVRAFRGSHLSLMMALQGVAGGSEKAPLVIHLPGFNEETVRATPLFELYAAGVRYRKALETLVTEAAAGRVSPDRIAAFTQEAELSLEGADAWLDALLSDGSSGLAAQLRAMRPSAVLDDLLDGGHVARSVGVEGDLRALWTQLTAWTGVPQEWREATIPGSGTRAEDVAFAVAGWVLAAEFVDDLKRPPVNALLSRAAALPRGVIDGCRALAEHLRQHHRDFYRRAADETEAFLADEVEASAATDLGKIDTFRFEEDKVLKAALVALDSGEWDPAATWASQRLDVEERSSSFWLREEPARHSAWQLVQVAARLGSAIGRAGARLPERDGLASAVQAYAERGAAVDQAHRHLEQRRAALLSPHLPEFETLRSRLDGMRRRWRQWADGWALDFNAVCRNHGFLPSPALQQRTLFNEVVRPLTQEAGTTALFVVDALRYEMGEELYRQVAETPATTIQLKARLAELPSVTSVGMNVLAPVARNGRLVPVVASSDSGGITGFSSGEFRVVDPETRRRVMHDRVGGGTCPWLTLDDVLSRDSTSLKRAVAQARLVVVHSQAIDHAGEKGVGPAVFDLEMQNLRAAWRLLRDAGVRRFVITSDHGFLLLDDAAATAQTHGRRVDPRRRHVFSSVAADHKGEVRVPLADLEYEGASGHVMFPESTAVFDTGRRPMSFVHGGNSLQERVIPVLTLVHRAAAGGSPVEYGVIAAAREGVAGMHCLEIGVEVVGQGSLDFGNAREVELGLRVPGRDDVEVELCQTRGSAAIQRGAVLARVGERFELFFRLLGSTDDRVRVELHHPSAVAEVAPCVPDARFAVTARGAAAASAAPALPVSDREGEAWLNAFEEEGVRQVFQHIAVHGAITEGEATGMLGGGRAMRRFALQFEAYADRAPFAVRIDTVAGVKRYVRDGGNT